MNSAVFDELILSMTSESKRLELTEAILRKKFTVANNFFVNARGFFCENKWHMTMTTEEQTVFGSIKLTAQGSKFNTNPSFRFIPEKNGIEILGCKPLEKGNTYSSKCTITIPELRECCKQNGIKATKLNKLQLLNALMKV